MSHTDTLNSLLSKCFLLPPEQERRIREQWETLEESARTNILSTLSEMVEKQEDMLTTMVKADPEFPQKLQGFLDRQVAQAQAGESTKRAGELAHIEQQLNT